MSVPPIDPVVSWLARTSLALLFGAAAMHKLRAPSVFLETLRAYRALPDPLAPYAAAASIGSELALVPCLLLPQASSFAAPAAATLLTLYTGAIAPAAGLRAPGGARGRGWS